MLKKSEFGRHGQESAENVDGDGIEENGGKDDGLKAVIKMRN